MIWPESVPSSVTYAECTRLSELAEGKMVLEIGSWMGRSTIALASTAESVVTVDWHQGDFYAGQEDTLPALIENLRLFEINNVTVIVGRIEDVEKHLAGNFDLIFIDADHSEEAAELHWQIARQLLAKNGVICFHDYERFGVTAVVDALPFEFEQVESLAIIRL